jgi:hypothetical protein
VVGGDGLKNDAGKPRLELIDVWAERLLGMVLTAGALEYTPDSWRRLNTPEGRARVVGSLMRHLAAYRGSHELQVAIDDQFGLPHSAHLLACAMFLAAFDAENLHLEDAWDGMEDTWRTAVEKRQLGNEKQTKEAAFEKAFDKFFPGNTGPCTQNVSMAGVSVPTGLSSQGAVDGSHGRRTPR